MSDDEEVASYVPPSCLFTFYIFPGPTPKTYADFWRMVWESQSVCIVMTTRCIERRTVKCGRYWPNVDEGVSTETYDNITVTVKVGWGLCGGLD